MRIMVLKRVLPRIIFLQIAASLLASATAVSNSTHVQSKPGCPNKCGEVDIPFPFGIGTDCAMEGFDLTCNDTFNPRKAFTGGVEIFNISLVTHELRAYIYMAKQCDGQPSLIAETTLAGPFLFSNARNKFTVVGCHTLAYIVGQNELTSSYASGCVSICNDERSISEGSCDGMGCCQTSVPTGLHRFEVSFDGGFNNSRVANFSPCSYAFLAGQDWFHFGKSNLSADFSENTNDLVPVVLDWAIRNQSSCRDAKLHPDTYACRSAKSECYDSINGDGYVCNCTKGYEGNPYLVGGCEDINECNLPERYTCHGVCTNTPGSYNCTCPEGTYGNATIPNCTAIQRQERFPLPARLAVGVSVSFVVLAALISSVIIKRQKMKHKRERDVFFKKNGGLKLYEQMISKKVDTIRVFTEEELQIATDNFDDKRVVGIGGHGMVYKGILDDHRVVAIKKSNIIDERQKDEFANEIIVLSQINHRNVVRLLGCCLELDIPMLVYEYISNGSLFDVLHNEHYTSPIPLKSRLRIAEQSAEALAYLHSGTSRSIIHGDVKSQNILLDDSFLAKVSDFGASHLVPMDENGFIMFVQGTLGYLDPECLQTRCLTDRSDVYSFGVVLLELITGKTAIYSDELGEKRSLASSFIGKVKEHKLREMLDDKMMEEGGMELLGEVANIVKECLNVKGEERPSMKEVAERLGALRRSSKLQPWKEYNPQETESLHGEPRYGAADTSSGFNSMDSRYLLKIDAGR